MQNALLERRTSVRQIDGVIGAEVDCGIVQQLDAATFAALHRACLDHLIVLIRGQSLSIPDLLAFGRRFGELSPAAPVHKGQKPREYPELAVISNVVENGVAIGGLGDGEAVWHSDSCFNEIPPSFSILHSLEIPPAGGDTGFSNMYAALDTLPPELLRAIRGKTIKHDLRYTSGGQLRPGYTGLEDIRTTPGPRHPIIRRHPDIRLLRRPTDIAGFVATQERLLKALWPLLAPGGLLLYASCSVLKAENGLLVRRFLRETPEAVDVTESARLTLEALPAVVSPGLPGLVLLPGAADQDGFGYAVLRRQTDGKQ